MTTRRVKEVRADSRKVIKGGIVLYPDIEFEPYDMEAVELVQLRRIRRVDILIIRIPTLPPKEYNQNSRCHWRVKAVAGRFYKQLVVSELPRSNWEDIGPLASARMKVIYHVDQLRHMDQDNAISRLKPAIDGLVASGLFLDDEHITIVEPVEFEKVDKGIEPWLELQLIDYRRAVDSQA